LKTLQKRKVAPGPIKLDETRLEEKDDADGNEEKSPKRRRVRAVARPGTFKFVDQSGLFGKFDFFLFLGF
jgi:hypothetical protein